MTVRVTDDGTPNLDDFETITITVGEVNEAPTLANIGDKSVNEGDLLTFTAAASDVDIPANTLTFTLDAGAPSGARINANTGVFTWNPNETQGPGSYDITVRVTDDGTPKLDDFETITITVGEVNSPEFTAVNDVSVFLGKPVSLLVQATDSDVPKNNLTYSLEPTAPAGAAIDPQSGEFRWTPSFDTPLGTVDIRVTVLDDGTPQRSDEKAFQILVLRPSFSNPRNRFDVDDNGSVGIRDVVAIATYVHSPGIGGIPLNYQPGLYIDVDDNVRAQVLDLALVVGEVHRIFGSGDSEPNRRGAVWFDDEDDERDFWYSTGDVDMLAADGLDRVVDEIVRPWTG